MWKPPNGLSSFVKIQDFPIFRRILSLLSIPSPGSATVSDPRKLHSAVLSPPPLSPPTPSSSPSARSGDL